MLGRQSAVGGQSAKGPDRSADRFDRDAIFGWRGLLYCRQSASVLPDSLSLLGGQSATARRTVRSVRRNLPSLIGSFAPFLVIPHVLRGIIPRTCS
jgi:hypothetical protein